MILKERGHLTVLLMGVVLLAGMALGIDPTAIDAVLEKVKADSASFNSSDAVVVDEFLESALGEMLTAKDFWIAIDVRGDILSRQGDASMGRYRTEFIAAARKHLRSALEEAEGPGEERFKRQTGRMLMVLVALLEDVSLSEFGIAFMQHPDSTIQYWAVKSVANPKMAEQLKVVSADNVQLLRNIVTSLESLIETQPSPEILRLIVNFAGDIGGSQGKSLLMKVADLRIKEYADWTVRYEFLESLILSRLASMIQAETSPQDKADLCRRFGQLYSYVIQRYMLGKDILKDVQKEQLASVMIETDQSAVAKLLGAPQGNMKKWIERKSMVALKSEHKSVLGDSSQAGELATKLNFDYGKDAAGKAITAPLELKAPPAKPSGSEQN